MTPSTVRSSKSRAARIAKGAKQVTVVLDAEGAAALEHIQADTRLSIKDAVQVALLRMDASRRS